MSTPPTNFPPPEPPPAAPETGAASVAWVAPATIGGMAETNAPAPATAHESASVRHPWSSRRRWTLGIGIAAASLGLLAALVGGTLALTSALTAALDDLGVVPAEGDALAEGPPAASAPVDPDVCVDPCFGAASIDQSRLDPAVADQAGLGVLYAGLGFEPQSRAVTEFDRAASGWRVDEGSPDSCFVTYPEVPIAYPLDSPPTTSDGSIHFVASRGSVDEGSSSLQTLRLFATTTEALDHLDEMQRQIAECRAYRLADRWDATVSAAPGLDLPDTVAAVGWVEIDRGGWRYYGFDLLRANAVVRFTLSTDNGVSEQQFRTLVEQAAADMAQWPLD